MVVNSGAIFVVVKPVVVAFTFVVADAVMPGFIVVNAVDDIYYVARYRIFLVMAVLNRC